MSLVTKATTPEQLRVKPYSNIGRLLEVTFQDFFGCTGSFGALGPVDLKFRTIDNKPHMPLYYHSLAPPSAGFGMSFRPVKWLAVGIGTSITIYTQMKQSIKLPLLQNKEMLGTTSVVQNLRPSLPFVGGITVEPIDGLRIAEVFTRSLATTNF